MFFFLVAMMIIYAVILYPMAFLSLSFSGHLSFTLIFFYTIVIGFFWVLGRFSMMLPAIAVDDESSLKNSWELTKNNHATMLFVVLFIPMIIVVLKNFSSLETPLFNSLVPFIYLFMHIFGIAFLSIAYKMFVDEKTQSLPIE